MSAAERASQPTVLRLRDLSSVVVAVAHMLGFQPHESLVAVALRGPRERMEFTLRLDLPSDEHHAAVAEEVAVRMAQAKATAVLLFVHSAEPPTGRDLPRRALIEAVTARLEQPVREALFVSGDRIWSYDCSDPRCCPPQGRLLDIGSSEAVEVAAAHALMGRAVAPDRDAAIACLRPLGGIAAESMRQATDRAAGERAAAGVPAFTRQVQAEIDELTERFADPRASLSHDEAARVSLGLRDVLLRDEVLSRAVGDDEGLERLLMTVARHAQAPDDAPVCTIVGFGAYARGNGLLASEAFERALRSDGGYRMAQLGLQALRGQLPPEEIRRLGSEPPLSRLPRGRG